MHSRYYVVGLISLLLCGCSIVVDDVRIHLKEDFSGKIQASLSGPENSDKIGSLNRAAQDCLVTSNQLPDDNGKVFFRWEFDFSNRDQLETFIRCSSFMDEGVTIKPVILEKGMLSHTYIIEFTIHAPFFYILGREGKPPESLSITMPGEIVSSSIEGQYDYFYEVKKDVVGDDRVFFSILHREDEIQEMLDYVSSQCSDDSGDDEACMLDAIQAYDPNISTIFRRVMDENPDSKGENIRLYVKSRVYKANIDTVIAFLGLIFGSGLLVGFYKLVMSRRST